MSDVLEDGQCSNANPADSHSQYYPFLEVLVGVQQDEAIGGHGKSELHHSRLPLSEVETFPSVYALFQIQTSDRTTCACKPWRPCLR